MNPYVKTAYCHCGHEEDDHVIDSKGNLTHCEQCDDCEKFREYTREDAEYDKADLAWGDR